jgi:secondary thiamine-phosphate synthase enzyme
MTGPTRIEQLEIDTQQRSQMLDITARIAELARRHDVRDGYAIIFVPHTTAGVTIQENADPDVQHDLLAKLDQLIPRREPYYRHGEGNSDSHLKTALVGTSQQVLIQERKLLLGQWQGIYLCEFDGPRKRQVMCRLVDLTRMPRIEGD